MLSLTFLISTICVLQFALNLVETREIISYNKLQSNLTNTEKKRQQNNSHENIEKFDNIIKFKFDDRKYQGLILENGLKVLLISDPFTDKSVASLSINFNFDFSSTKLKCLTFFSLYTFYFGSKKYPKPYDFYNFLNQHDGGFNLNQIFTTNNFFFEINPNYLEPALDRFAQFFLFPLYDEVLIEKVLKNIYFNSATKLLYNIQRIYYFNTKTIYPDFYKLFIVNGSNFQEVFGTNTTFIEELKQFYLNHFSANMMSLVVLGKESLNELYDMITKKIDFSKIINKNLIYKNYENFYKKKDVKKIVKIVSSYDSKELRLFFLIPDLKKYYPGQTLFYIEYLINDKSKGSIFFELKSKQFIYNILTVQNRFSGINEFQIRIHLTEKGFANVDEIIKIVFQYFNMAKKNGFNKSIFDQVKYSKELIFNFESKEDPMDFARFVSFNMYDFPIDKVIKNSYILDEYHPEIITEVLGYFIPDNMRIIIIAKNFEKDENLLEDYFKIKYSYNNISEQSIQNWSEPGFNKNLKLPTGSWIHKFLAH